MEIHMRMSMLCLALYIVPWSFLHAQALTGTWQGTLEGSRTLRIQVVLTKKSSTTLAGVLNSIDQGVSVPLSSVEQDGKHVRLGMNSIFTVQRRAECRCFKDGWSVDTEGPTACLTHTYTYEG